MSREDLLFLQEALSERQYVSSGMGFGRICLAVGSYDQNRDASLVGSIIFKILCTLRKT